MPFIDLGVVPIPLTAEARFPKSPQFWQGRKHPASFAAAAYAEFVALWPGLGDETHFVVEEAGDAFFTCVFQTSEGFDVGEKVFT